MMAHIIWWDMLYDGTYFITYIIVITSKPRLYNTEIYCHITYAIQELFQAVWRF